MSPAREMSGITVTYDSISARNWRRTGDLANQGDEDTGLRLSSLRGGGEESEMIRMWSGSVNADAAIPGGRMFIVNRKEYTGRTNYKRERENFHGKEYTRSKQQGEGKCSWFCGGIHWRNKTVAGRNLFF